MASIYDVNAQELIDAAAQELGKDVNFKAREGARFVKTGMHADRVPEKKDWWQVRAAAILRTVSRYGPLGTAKLRVRYGGQKRRGYRPPHFYPASGNIIRTILQQLEKAGYVKQQEKSVHKGRVV